MAFKFPGVDLATGALILSGAGLLVASLVAAAILFAPPQSSQPAAAIVAPTATPVPTGRPSAALPPDRVATVLNVDVSAGAGGAARPGDHVDVLGYFPAQTTGTTAVTRVLLQDVPVLDADGSASSVALTLAVPQASALLLQEAQALGAHPFITLRSLQLQLQSASLPDIQTSFSDADLLARLNAGGH